MMQSLSSLFKSSSAVILDKKIENQKFQEMLQIIGHGFTDILLVENLNASAPLVQGRGASMKTLVFGVGDGDRRGPDFENYSVFGPGIMCIPALSSSSASAVIATRFGIKIFNLESLKSDTAIRITDAISTYFDLVKDSLLNQKVIGSSSPQGIDNYVTGIMANAIEAPPENQAQILSLLSSISDNFHSCLQKQTIVDVLMPNNFQKRILEWDIVQRILDKPLSTLWAPPDRSLSLFLKEEGLLLAFGSDKRMDEASFKYEFAKIKYQTMKDQELLHLKKVIRDARVMEILGTERKFISCLKLLEHTYNDRILTEGEANGLPSVSFVHSLVVPVGSLISAHETFISVCEKEATALNVANSFVDNSQSLEENLTKYCNEQVQSDLNINRSTSKAFKLYLQKLENELMNASSSAIDLGFQSLRGQPIQRVTRYAILFKELLETIDPQEHGTYESVLRAYQKACSLATKVNTSQRDGDTQKYVFQTTLANKFRIPIKANTEFITDVKIVGDVNKKGVSTTKWILLFSTYLVILSGTPKTYEKRIELEALQLQQIDQNVFILSHGDGVYMWVKMVDSIDRCNRFLKYLRHHILLQSEFKDMESSIYAEHNGQLDLYYRTLSTDNFDDFMNEKNRGDVLMILFDESDDVQTLVNIQRLHYNAIFVIQVLPNSFNYSFRLKGFDNRLSSIESLQKFREPEVKLNLLLALKNVTLMKLWDGCRYSERDKALLNGYIIALTSQLSLDIQESKKRKKGRYADVLPEPLHSRKATSTSMASSIASLVQDGVKGIGRVFSIKRNKSIYADSIRTGNGFGSPAASITSVHLQNTPEKHAIRNIFPKKILLSKKTYSLERLQIYYSDVSNIVFQHLLSRSSDCQSNGRAPNVNVDELSKVLMSGNVPNLQQYSIHECLDSLKNYTLSHPGLFFNENFKKGVAKAARSTSLDSELVPLLELLVNTKLSKDGQERFSKFLFSLKRLSQKSQESWWPDQREMAEIFAPIFNFSKTMGLQMRDFPEEDQRRALDCLIFHHDSNNEKAASTGNADEQDTSSIVGETFFTSNFAEATKVLLPEMIQYTIQTYCLEDHLTIAVQASDKPCFQDSEVATLNPMEEEWFDMIMPELLCDPFEIVPFTINVFNSDNFLEESLMILRPGEYKQPLLSDDTMASLSLTLDDSVVLEGEKVAHSLGGKPGYLAEIAAAGKTFTSLADLENEVDLILMNNIQIYFY